MANTLKPGDCLSTNQNLTSANGTFTLVLQEDGNLVLSAEGNPQWSTGTYKGGPMMNVCMQRDGNLVMTSVDGKTIAWSSKTSGNPGAYLVLQNDGNLVIYYLHPIWASGS